MTLKCYKLDPELEKRKDIPLLLLGDSNARHLIQGKNFKALNNNGKVLKGIVSQHNVQIQNDKNSTYVHKRRSSTIDLVLTGGISNLKCQIKEFDLINTFYKGIITTSHNKRPLNKKKIQTQGY